MRIFTEFRSLLWVTAILFALVLTACGREAAPLASCSVSAPPCTEPVTAPTPVPSKYPYFFTLICNGRLGTVTVTGPAMEPVTCAEAPSPNGGN